MYSVTHCDPLMPEQVGYQQNIHISQHATRWRDLGRQLQGCFPRFLKMEKKEFFIWMEPVGYPVQGELGGEVGLQGKVTSQSLEEAMLMGGQKGWAHL